MKKVELLAPAGNYEALTAAVESGADAVYMGGSRFNARAFADNFDDEALKEAVHYAHIRGVKIYITVNILLLDSELQEAVEYIKYLYSIDVDAVIVQDMALLLLVKRLLPDFEIICSTQMTVHNSGAAKLLADRGARRIVVARELSLGEIKAIIAKAGVEAEAFVHGALCVCYSGQCYMSSMIGGRSGNRGRCAQPCRRKYSFCDSENGKRLEKHSGKHLLSTRDLNTYDRLKELVASGITSFKIEGRMKRPEYVATVVENYRAAIDRLERDEESTDTRAAQAELTAIFNREFTQGYLFGKRNREIVSIERPDNRGVYIGKITGVKGRIVSVLVEAGRLNDGDGIEIADTTGRSAGALISGIKVGGSNAEQALPGQTASFYIKDRAEIGAAVSKTYDSKLHRKAKEEYYYENRKKISVRGKITLRKGEKPLVKLADADGNRITHEGGLTVETALKTPTSEEKIREQFEKTGDTPYIFEDLEIAADKDVFLPVRELNTLRREALESLSRIRAVIHKDRNGAVEVINIDSFVHKAQKPQEEAELIAGITDSEGAAAALDAGADTIYLLGGLRQGNLRTAREIAGLCAAKNAGVYIVLPVITKDDENEELQQLLQECGKEAGITGIVISNLGQLELAKQAGFERIRTNYTLNAFNSITVQYLCEQGAECVAVSPELNLKQIKSIAARTGAALEGFVYGHMPLMTLEYCPESLLEDCGKCQAAQEQGIDSRYGIIDEKGKVFPVLKLGNCRTQILNGDPYFLFNELDRLLESGIRRQRADFYIESCEEISDITRLYKNYFNNKKDACEELVNRIAGKGYTKGHYFRGVD